MLRLAERLVLVNPYEDLRTYRAAGLTGCDRKTVKVWVKGQREGGTGAAPRPRLADPYPPLIRTASACLAAGCIIASERASRQVQQPGSRNRIAALGDRRTCSVRAALG